MTLKCSPISDFLIFFLHWSPARFVLPFRSFFPFILLFFASLYLLFLEFLPRLVTFLLSEGTFIFFFDSGLSFFYPLFFYFFYFCLPNPPMTTTKMQLQVFYFLFPCLILFNSYSIFSSIHVYVCLLLPSVECLIPNLFRYHSKRFQLPLDRVTDFNEIWSIYNTYTHR